MNLSKDESSRVIRFELLIARLNCTGLADERVHLMGEVGDSRAVLVWGREEVWAYMHVL